ncbi:hypothetical protein [Pseudophaeobacter flagellatus]|uniref:hypothetical protein n=1 Tax=Pseudophaeobacter flagellatus TaxID=2899119 RepID=UPI001E578809|nr:hypothetical protein [Pseudophaeobacter flagellatus]MCD9146586.1 hypothetical protein [Pseudophaeobacter flagellatus]
MRILALISACLISTAASAEYIRGSDYGYKLWEGAAYTDSQSGRFSHCVVSAPYKSGDTLLISFTKEKKLVVGVSNDDFNFDIARNIPVTIYVDRRPPIYATATPVSSTMVTLSMPNFDQAMRFIQMGRTMQIDGRQFSGVYDLTGTKVALERTYSCASNYYDYAEALSQQGGLSQRALFQIASNMITSIDVSDATYLSDAEIQDLGFGADSVFWASDDLGVLAGTLTAHRPTGDLRATDSEDLAFMSGLCKGDFASSSQKVSHVEGISQRELHGVCRLDDGDTHIIVAKTDIGEHTLYNVVFFFDSEKAGEVKRVEATGNIAIHSARYATE